MTSGMIEIKCPENMYSKLKIHQLKKENHWVPDRFYHQHIYTTHYDQMQGCMALTKKAWCDYVVFCSPTECGHEEVLV